MIPYNKKVNGDWFCQAPKKQTKKLKNGPIDPKPCFVRNYLQTLLFWGLIDLKKKKIILKLQMRGLLVNNVLKG